MCQVGAKTRGNLKGNVYPTPAGMQTYLPQSACADRFSKIFRFNYELFKNRTKSTSPKFRGSIASKRTSEWYAWRSTVPVSHSTRQAAPSRAVTTPNTKALSGAIAPKPSKNHRTGLPTARSQCARAGSTLPRCRDKFTLWDVIVSFQLCRLHTPIQSLLSNFFFR